MVLGSWFKCYNQSAPLVLILDSWFFRNNQSPSLVLWFWFLVQMLQSERTAGAMVLALGSNATIKAHRWYSS
jgi:hypothetical protein